MTNISPSIKGSGVSSLIEDLSKMREEGRAPAALLEQRLTPSDRALLDQPVNLAAWYDIHSYRRLAELLCEVEGRREDLLRERGAAAARRLAEAGLHLCSLADGVLAWGQDDARVVACDVGQDEGHGRCLDHRPDVALVLVLVVLAWLKACREVG